MFLEKLSLREKRIFWLAIGLILLAILDRSLFQGIWREFRSIDKEISFLQKKIRKNSFIISRSQKVNKDHTLFNQYLRETVKSDEEEVAKILSLIEDKAKSSKISLKNMKPYPMEKLKSGKRYTIEIETETTVGHLVNFIYEVESSKELLKVEKMQVSLKEETEPVLKVFLLISRLVVLN